MTDLLSLPTELIVLILSYSTAQTAARLARANKELQAIWRKHNDQILTCIVKNILPAPAYQDALELASLQSMLLPSCELIDATYFGRILHDATLASMTVAAWKLLDHTRTPNDMYGSYYFVRKLVLAGRCHRKARHGGHALKRALYSVLRAKSTPTRTISSYAGLIALICFYDRNRRPGLSHGVWNPYKLPNDDWDPEWECRDALHGSNDLSNYSEDDSDGSEGGSGDSEEESDGTESRLPSCNGRRVNQWKYCKYADDVLHAVWMDRWQRTRTLKPTIFKKI
jgi:hypothetical protein